MALYAAAAAGGGTAQWFLDAATSIANYDARPRREQRADGPWDQESYERGERLRRLGGEEDGARDPWVQFAATALGFVLPILWQAMRELIAKTCGRPRASGGRARQLEELDRLAREVLVAGNGAAAVLAADHGVRAHELVAWAESWTATSQGPLTFSRITQPEVTSARR